ncbi:hypothetical protein KAJ77_11165, partial [bacterium]|nr:hypothetical protein [bacterium]
MRTARITTTLTAVLLILFTYACSQGQESTESATSEAAATSDAAVGDAAALVNGQSIPMSELQTAVRNVVMQNGMDGENLDAFMGQFGPRI